MNFCGSGIDITGDGISQNYTSTDGTLGVSIISTYAVNESCPAGGKTTWDEARCKFLLNRPLGECAPDGAASDSVDLYGMSPCDYPHDRSRHCLAILSNIWPHWLQAVPFSPTASKQPSNHSTLKR